MGFQEIKYNRASVRDAEAITEHRMQFLKDADPKTKEATLIKLRETVLEYFVQAIPTGDCVCYLASLDNKIVGGGGFVIRRCAPGLLLPDGISAYIFNVYTAPEFRRQGIARHILRLLMQEAKQQNITRVELHATEMGRTLYEELGFHPPNHVYLEWFPNNTFPQIGS